MMTKNGTYAATSTDKKLISIKIWLTKAQMDRNLDRVEWMYTKNRLWIINVWNFLKKISDGNILNMNKTYNNEWNNEKAAC